MKTCVKCGHQKAFSEFYKNPELLDGHYNDCKECRRRRTRANRKENPEAHKARSRERYAANPEKHRAQKRKSAKKTISKILSRNRAYSLAKEMAVPKWVSQCFGAKVKIDNMYRSARELTVSTGVKHHVDHIVPIRGKNVCGLHVPKNLQILTGIENIRKRNKWHNVNDALD